MKKYRLIATIIMILVGLLFSVKPARAVPQLPYYTKGTVRINGAVVPENTIISGWVNGYKCGTTNSTASSTYNLQTQAKEASTPGLENCGVDGLTVIFHIGDVVANETGIFESGNDPQTINLTASVNVSPVITEGDTASVTMSEDGSPTAFGLTLHATDINSSDILTWSISTQAKHGTATASGTGASKVINYVPAVNYSGSDSFVARVSDGSLTDTITVNVTITAQNDVPVITEGTSTSVSMSVNSTPTAFALTLHATDVDTSDTLTWSISTTASHGTATASGTGASKVIGYTPTIDYAGSDSFVVQVSDGTTTDAITVNVAIIVPNYAPVITEGASTSVTISEDGSPTAFSLTLHATDANPVDTLTWSISAAASHGTATASGTGTSKVIRYTPSVNYNGSDSFVARVTDGSLTDTITVNVTITAVNDAPVITEGTTTTVSMNVNGTPTAFALTLHATDVDSSTLTWSISSAALHGTANTSGTGASKVISYSPNTDYEGSDSFVVQVSDGSLADTITVNVTIILPNIAPVITEGASIDEVMDEDGAPTAFSVTLHGTDANVGDTLTWSISTKASHGTATASGTGASKAINYAPASNYNGTDSFVVRVSDGLLTDTITVNITISPQNDAPVITEGISITVTMSENGTPTAFSLTLHATDIDSTTFTWTISSPASHGAASTSGTGALKVIHYAPVINFYGNDSFTVLVSDGSLTDTITVNVTVLPIPTIYLPVVVK